MSVAVSTFYRHLKDSQRLLLSRSEHRWVDRVCRPDRSPAAVLNFGCGMQLTPHLLVETVDVFEALGVDIVAVAGTPWCCGRPRALDDPAADARIVEASARRIADYRPREAVNFCGGWWLQYPPVVPEGETPLQLTHVTEFLARSLRELADDVPWQTTLDRRVLLHPKTQDLSPQQLAERASTMETTDSEVPKILGSIPGVVIVGIADNPSYGAPCAMDDGESVLARCGPGELREVRRQLEQQADRTEANVLVCSHHMCYREWGKHGGERLPVRHYISLVAEALGVARTSRYHQCWGLDSIESIVAEMRPAWESWGVPESEALQMAARLFPAHPSLQHAG